MYRLSIARAITLTLTAGLLVFSGQTRAASATDIRIKAVAFDYFVIFDPNSVLTEAEKAFPGEGFEFTKAWRSKQFEYGFLRSITNNHEDFFKVTSDALDYTVEQMHLKVTPESRARLLKAYSTLKPWPDAVAALKKLKAAGLHIITISNFSRAMLRANAENAGIADLFNELLSTEVNGTYKPDPRAYALGMERLHLRKDEIVFAAFAGWDAYGARRFGYTTVWVNRFNLPMDKLGATPDRICTSMDDLVEFLLGASANALRNLPLVPEHTILLLEKNEVAS